MEIHRPVSGGTTNEVATLPVFMTVKTAVVSKIGNVKLLCDKDKLIEYVVKLGSFATGIVSSICFAKKDGLPIGTAALASTLSYLTGKTISHLFFKIKIKCLNEENPPLNVPTELLTTIVGVQFFLGTLPSWMIVKHLQNPLTLKEISTLNATAVAAGVVDTMLLIFLSIVYGHYCKRPPNENLVDPSQPASDIEMTTMPSQSNLVHNKVDISEMKEIEI